MPRKKAKSHAEGFGPAPSSGQRLRMRLVLLASVAVFIGIGFQLARIQLYPDPRLIKKDLRKVAHTQLRIPRGNIYDARGKVMATDKMAFALVADPSVLRAAALPKDDGEPLDANTLAPQVASIVGQPDADVFERMTRGVGESSETHFVYIKRWLSDAEVASLREQNLIDGKFLRLESEPRRYYPHGQSASHVLGFAGRERIGEQNERVGAEGIELAYDRYLRNIDGVRKSRADAKRRPMESLTLSVQQPEGGDHVYLTIDLTLQYELEQQLLKAQVENNAKRATGVLMDPYTGAIRALACVPAFDPNQYWEFTAEQRKNHAIVDVFEPGSVFKIVTMAAALEAGVTSPEDFIDCQGGVMYRGRRRIRDFHKLGVVPLRESFVESSNIAMVQLAERLGDARFAEWIQRFGFGTRTCTDLRGESPGIFRPDVTQWSAYSRDSLSFGQEISVTPIQLARAFAIIANGGYYVEPYLVEQAIGREGEVTYRHEGDPPQQILSERTVAIMQEFCHEVVTRGTATQANIPDYRAGGKTGTAQIAKPDGGYFEDKSTTVFAGFAPMAKPRLVAVIVIHEPDVPLAYGGRVCGPVFREVMRDALIEMGVPKDPVAGKIAAAPEARDDADTVTPHVDMALLDASLGELLHSDGPAELPATDMDRSMQEAPAMPDFTGLTKAQARAALANLDLEWEPEGAGWVIAQDPMPGTPLAGITRCRLIFGSKSAHAIHPAEPSAAPDRL